MNEKNEPAEESEVTFRDASKDGLVKHAQYLAADLNETLRLLQVRHNVRFRVDNEYSIATRLIDGDGIWSLKIKLSQLIGG